MTPNSEEDYEDLLAEWSDLESGLGIILANPDSTQQFAHRVLQYDRWMQALMRRDPDVGLYLLFQLAGNSPVGYSASHALVCSVLCHLIASELLLPPKERDSLVHAALTMNIAMTTVQDVLASQTEKLTHLQQDLIRLHPVKGAMMLGKLGVLDEHWLEVVSQHHATSSDAIDFRQAPVGVRLSRILRMVDRYAAMISPRMSRAGRSATESARAVMAGATANTDPIGHAMLRVVGLCPPGTYVRMDSGELAVVVRRSNQINLPFVVIVGATSGEMLAGPLLHNTAQGAPHIRSALPASGIRAPLNHFMVVKVGVQGRA
jgi:hypothetical protein